MLRRTLRISELSELSEKSVWRRSRFNLFRNKSLILHSAQYSYLNCPYSRGMYCAFWSFTKEFIDCKIEFVLVIYFVKGTYPVSWLVCLWDLQKWVQSEVRCLIYILYYLCLNFLHLIRYILPLFSTYLGAGNQQ